MHKDWIQDLRDLENFDLSVNHLQEVPDDTFHELTKLTELFLGGNLIKSIRRKMIQRNDQLKFIGLKENRIKEIQSGSFAHLSKLTELGLNQNICTKINSLNKTPDKIAEELTSCHTTPR